MSQYFNCWVDLSGIEHNYKSIVNLILMEQFLNSCQKELVVYLKERKYKSIDQMATAAEVYTEAHGLHCFSFGKPYGKFQKNDKPMQRDWKGQQFDSAKGNSKKEGKSDFTPRYPRCYNCNGFGHLASECKKPTKPKQEHSGGKQKYVSGAMKKINQETRENIDSTEEKQVESSLRLWS